MDDDLMSLRGNRNTNDDDLFAAFSDLGSSTSGGDFDSLGDMSDLDRDFTSPSSLPLADETPDWLAAFQEGERAASAAPEAPSRGREAPKTPERESTPRTGFRFGKQAVPSSRAVSQAAVRRPRRSDGLLLGMTPQQRMILSIFLFLDVTILGFLILIAIGAISI